MKPKINSTKQLLFLAVAVVLIFEVTAVYAEEFVNNYKFPSQWEHRPEPVKTKDGGNVPPGLAPYNPDPYNFHPTGNQSDPGVIIDKGKFKIWYSAYIEPNGQGMQGIAYTTSEDGILWEDPKDRETWVKLVVKPWGQGGWDCLALETPNVCVHPNTGKYYMYTSDRYEGQKFYIGLATSDDGVNWVRYSEPVLKPKYDWEQSSSGVLEPSVIYDEKEQIFKMWYASFGTLNGRWQGYVGYATSKDGIHWERLSQPIFLPEAGKWDAEIVGHENVIRDPNGGYHMFYLGTDSIGSSGLYGIGHAYSEDGIHWQRDPNNPIVKREPGTWKSGMVGGPAPVFYNGKLYLYYFGSKNDRVWTQVYFGLSIATFADSQNNPPVLDPIGNKSVKAGDLLEFTVTASDPEGDPLTYSASGLPQGASFDANTRKFSWRPSADQAGKYSVTFSVSDGKLSDSETINIEVATSGFRYGDVSQNGEVTAYDAALTAQYAIGLIELTPEQIKAADVSGNNEVSAYDAALIAQKAVGLIEKFPIEG